MLDQHLRQASGSSSKKPCEPGTQDKVQPPDQLRYTFHPRLIAACHLGVMV